MEFQRLSDEEWALIAPLFPQEEKRKRGKPHACWRFVVQSILWVLVTKKPWTALPQEEGFASKSTANRWFVTWDKNGFLDHFLGRLREGKWSLSLPKRRVRLKKGQISCPLNLCSAAV